MSGEKELTTTAIVLGALVLVGFCPALITDSLDANLSQLLTTTLVSK